MELQKNNTGLQSTNVEPKKQSNLQISKKQNQRARFNLAPQVCLKKIKNNNNKIYVNN